MLRVFLVDDEEPVLNLMERLLEANDHIEIAGRFTRPEEAISRMLTERVDVVFLDIQMPGMNGIEAAEYLMEAAPGIDIVFVTAYNHYAIEAFELSAVDYILKPPTANRLNKTIRRLVGRWELRNQGERKDSKELAGDGKQGKKNTSNEELKKRGPAFYCFGHFEWIVDAETGEAVKWRRLKDRELMAYLVHKRNRFVSKGSILEDLWPGAHPEQATAFLHTCVYNIRKKMNLLGCKEKLEYRDNGYRLELLEMWCDADEFERMAGSMNVDAGSIEEFEVIAKLYKDNYLEKEGFIWAYEAEKVLKDTYVLLMKRMADYYKSILNYDSSMNCLQNAHSRHPFHDVINESILLGYARLGDRQSMIRHYERSTRLLKDELGIEPMQTTVQLYQRLCSGSDKDNSLA